MKVIDLLNKIANGEQPLEIVFRETKYKWDKYMGEWGYVDKSSSPYSLFYKHFDCDSKEDLNEEVEILEKNKIPEKLTQFEAPFLKGDKPDIRFSLIIDQINEIIDYLENKE